LGHVVTIGTFDGVHAGHRALVQRARELAGQGEGGGRVTALVFDPHPLAILRPEAAPGRLSSFQMREKLVREAGADHVERLVPTPALLALSARAFVEDLVKAHHPSAIVEGPDFRFGAGREGTVLTLDDLGRKLGYSVDVLPPVEIALMDLTLVRASSSIVRWLLAEGRVRDAALVLGRPYEIEGSVERGDRRGRQIGFPTANIATEYLMPGDGIYACRAFLPDGRSFAAGVHVGPRETFGDRRRVIEAHLLGAERDDVRLKGLPEYGWNIRLQFVSWLRDPVRFESVAHLVHQMNADCRRAADIVANDDHVQATMPSRTPFPSSQAKEVPA
jgi:riboflavin kinase / FMN adenylyltransferase